jgi:branched-chain amino acid transport system permease protein
MAAPPPGVEIISLIVGGITDGSIYAVVAVGLTLIFGMMGVINFAHGSFFMLGAYIGFSLVALTGNFFLALALTPLVGIPISYSVERVLLRPTYKSGLVTQFLLTFSLALFIEWLVTFVWGPQILQVVVPRQLMGIISIGGSPYPEFYIFLTIIALGLFASLWLFLERTNMGLIIRAGIYNREMVSALGVNMTRIYLLIFIVGSAFAMFSGFLAAPILGVSSTLGDNIIIVSFIVVVVGGLGSVKGSIIAGYLIGFLEFVGIVLFSGIGLYLIYILMIIVLIIRPRGLFGKSGVLEWWIEAANSFCW